MKKTMMKKIFALWIAGLAVILMVGPAFAWEAGTHAYIEQLIHKKMGHVDSSIMNNRIYGANALDIFNNKFTSPYLECAGIFHDTSDHEYFLQAWQIASTSAEKAFAYGFVSHNNKWGMDSTAHISGITYGRGTGYVIAKAQVLAGWLGPFLETNLGLTLPYETLVNLCHYLVESGVDFLVRQKDPLIGSKLMAAASYRSNEAPALLVNAYKGTFVSLGIFPNEAAAAAFIAQTEAEYQNYLFIYGLILSIANEDDAINAVAQGLADVGASYLGFPHDPATIAALTFVAKQGILQAMDLCKPDFEREIAATIGWVNGRLSKAKVQW